MRIEFIREVDVEVEAVRKIGVDGGSEPHLQARLDCLHRDYLLNL